MKYLLITLFSISLFACQKEEPVLSAQETWLLNGMETEVFTSVKSTTNGTFQISLKSESLCPSEGVIFVISSDDDEHFRDTINAFPYEMNAQVPANTDLTIYSKIEWGLGQAPGAVCVWLGEVNCLVEY